MVHQEKAPLTVIEVAAVTTQDNSGIRYLPTAAFGPIGDWYPGLGRARLSDR